MSIAFTKKILLMSLKKNGHSSGRWFSMLRSVKLCFFADKHNAVAFNYKLLDGKILATTITSFKYLGVQITDNISSWDLHVNSITLTVSKSETKRVLFNAPKKIKKIAYVTLCRPLLEYACEVWDLFLAKHIVQIEKVRRRAVRFISNLRGHIWEGSTWFGGFAG